MTSLIQLMLGIADASIALLSLNRSILPSSFFILHSSFLILPSSFFILHSSFFILHSSLNIESPKQKGYPYDRNTLVIGSLNTVYCRNWSASVLEGSSSFTLRQ